MPAPSKCTQQPCLVDQADAVAGEPDGSPGRYKGRMRLRTYLCTARSRESAPAAVAFPPDRRSDNISGPTLGDPQRRVLYSAAIRDRYQEMGKSTRGLVL